MTFNEAYDAHATADKAWMDQIRRAYPHEWAGDVRYTDRAHGAPGTPLRAAYDEYMRTRAVFEQFLPPVERFCA